MDLDTIQHNLGIFLKLDENQKLLISTDNKVAVDDRYLLQGPRRALDRFIGLGYYTPSKVATYDIIKATYKALHQHTEYCNNESTLIMHSLANLATKLTITYPEYTELHDLIAVEITWIRQITTGQLNTPVSVHAPQSPQVATIDDAPIGTDPPGTPLQEKQNISIPHPQISVADDAPVAIEDQAPVVAGDVLADSSLKEPITDKVALDSSSPAQIELSEPPRPAPANIVPTQNQVQSQPPISHPKPKCCLDVDWTAIKIKFLYYYDTFTTKLENYTRSCFPKKSTPN